MAKEPQNSSDLLNNKKNIIIIKRPKKREEGHHGGMWKVAYADFVTAMMAFFLLMWLINTISSDKLKGVAEYFTPVVGLKGQAGSGMEGGTDPQSTKGILSPKSSTESLSYGSPKTGPLDSDTDFKGSITSQDEQKIIAVMNNLEQNLDGSSETSKYADNLSIQRTPEGIKINIMDSINRSVFKPGSIELQPYMNRFLDVIASLVKNVPNYISIECHTSAVVDKSIANVDQWTLSTERADQVRKYYEKRVKDGQILKVIGRADTEPFDFKDPTNPKNVRIVVTLLTQDSVGNYQQAAPSK